MYCTITRVDPINIKYTDIDEPVVHYRAVCALPCEGKFINWLIRRGEDTAVAIIKLDGSSALLLDRPVPTGRYEMFPGKPAWATGQQGLV